jgi:putative ABC transport system ATP-binding protein
MQPMSALAVRGLVKSFTAPGGAVRRVVDVREFTLAQGEQAALCGQSGAGKTTLLNLIAGILQPDEGTVSVAGVEMTALGEAARDRARAQHVGYVFQTFNLLQGYSAIENVLLGATFGPARADRASATALLERVGLGARLRHLPAEMSIGEQQRVAVARALVKRPQLILADEPTGSLDPRHAAEVVALLRAACRERGCALVVVTHEASIAAAFDQRLDFRDLNRALATPGGAP